MTIQVQTPGEPEKSAGAIIVAQPRLEITDEGQLVIVMPSGARVSLSPKVPDGQN